VQETTNSFLLINCPSPNRQHELWGDNDQAGHLGRGDRTERYLSNRGSCVHVTADSLIEHKTLGEKTSSTHTLTHTRKIKGEKTSSTLSLSHTQNYKIIISEVDTHKDKCKPFSWEPKTKRANKSKLEQNIKKDLPPPPLPHTWIKGSHMEGQSP